MGKWLFLISICMILLTTACATPTPTPTALPPSVTAATLPPAATSTPIVLPPPPTSTPTEVTTMPTSNPNLQTKDLSSFVEAWNSRDIQSIRALYSDNARIISESDAGKLGRQEPVDLTLNEELIAGCLQSIPETMKMRIVGEPMMVFDKLVAFTYRIEGETEGYNAAGLLRYEGDKIYQHVFVVSDNLTSNSTPNTELSLKAPIDAMIEAWNQGDLQTASGLYSKDAIILSDEDLAQASWRDFQTPPTLKQLFNQFSGWKPAMDSPLVQMDDAVIFAWGWSIRNFPAGHGVRLVKFQDGMITMDIRYAIRPWEVEGRKFATD